MIQRLATLTGEMQVKHDELRGELLARVLERLAEQGRANQELIQGTLHSITQHITGSIEGLTRTTDTRLEQITGKVNERLEEGFKKTNETFTSVMARLATIDEAQKKIDGLTTNVVSLQELLGDKRSRGAFGEVQLESLVRNLLPANAFEFQFTLSNGNRVDCALKLPEPTGLVSVDAKFPLENYHRMFEPGLAEADRKPAQREFQADLRKHINDISTKYICRARPPTAPSCSCRRGRLRRDPRPQRRDRRLRHAAAGVDRIAHDDDGGAEYGPSRHQGRGDAAPGAHHQGRAVQAGQGVRTLRPAHEEARRSYPPGQR